MRALARALVVLGIMAGLSAGCHHGPPPEVGANSEGSEVVIRVVNHNFSDMVIYLDQSGQHLRIGEAGGKTTTELVVPWLRVSANPAIRLIADPIGARGAYRSDRLHLHPGAFVVLNLGSILNQSNTEIY